MNMKRLVIVRHGKSSWEHSVIDEKRPLKDRAYKDAESVTAAFKGVFQKPAIIWSSPAVRAHETAKIFRERLNIDEKDFIVKPGLYTFNREDLYNVISTCGKEVDQLIIFGHNPAFTSLVNRLGDKEIANVPTTGLVVIDFETNSWNDLKDGKTILNLFPKNLRK